MAYEALYRKYRPKRFADVVGQQHITSTLSNQVISGKVAHAYLFCGTRGTGKTTTARIFSKAINCENPDGGEPCGKCEGCLAYEDGIDILEIDGGSNGGVDAARDLVEKVRFAPVACRYKVYIIDEVHILTGPAFTALLKTLEEPPSHTIFILATTEPGKLPATIHSRCQRFNFRRVSTPDLMARLKYIVDDVGASYDDEGLRSIALAGQGSVRDMLSIADECLALCGNDLIGEKVRTVLGGVSKQTMFKFVDNLLMGNIKDTLIHFDSYVSEGIDFSVFVRDLSSHFRDLMVAISCGADASLIDASDEELKLLNMQAKSCPIEKALRAIDILSATEGTMKWHLRPRIAVESALVRICRPQDESNTPEVLLERISTLEKKLENGVLVTNMAVQKPLPPPFSTDGDTKSTAEDATRTLDNPPPFNVDKETESFRAQTVRASDASLSGVAKDASARIDKSASDDIDTLFNKLLSELPGPLQPLIAGWKYSRRNGKLELLVPKDMRGKLGGLSTIFEKAMERVRHEKPELDAVMVYDESATATVKEGSALRELGEQIFGELS